MPRGGIEIEEPGRGPWYGKIKKEEEEGRMLERKSRTTVMPWDGMRIDEPGRGPWCENKKEWRRKGVADQAKNVLEWLGKGVNIRELMRPFRGSFMGVNYDSTDPPSRALKTTTFVNSFRSLLQRHFYSASRLGKSVSGVGLGT